MIQDQNGNELLPHRNTLPSTILRSEMEARKETPIDLDLKTGIDLEIRQKKRRVHRRRVAFLL